MHSELRYEEYFCITQGLPKRWFGIVLLAIWPRVLCFWRKPGQDIFCQKTIPATVYQMIAPLPYSATISCLRFNKFTSFRLYNIDLLD